MNPSLWERVREVLETSPLLRVLLVLVLTVLATFIFEGIYRRIFRRIAARTRSPLDDTLFGILHPALRSSVVLGGVSVGAVQSGLPSGFVHLLHCFALTLAVLIWMVALIRGVSTTLRYLGDSRRFSFLQPRTVPLFDTLQKVVVAAGAIYFAFLVWNIDVTGWVASAGILGIAVGFAAKDTLANLFSGVFIMVDAPYRIGDMIVFESGERGLVTDVGIRSTRILTREDVEIIIPNSAIGAGKIINESGGPHRKRRVDVRVGVSYASDIGRVRRVLEQVAAEVDLVCDDPPASVRFREMAESALIFSLLFWIEDPEHRGRAVDRVNTRIFERFREEGIEIPFPQRVVHWPEGPPHRPLPSRGG